MIHLEKFKALLILIVIGLVSLPALVKDLKVFAQDDKTDSPPNVTCYRSQMVIPKDKKQPELDNELKQLDQLYVEGKINLETYTARKEKLIYHIQQQDNK